MKEKGGTIGGVRPRTVERELIRNTELVGVHARVGGAGVAAGMEDDFPGLLDLREHFGAVRTVGLAQPEELIVVDA